MEFEAYVAGAQRRLLRFATVMTDDVHQAQDTVQEVLLRAQQRWAQIGTLEHTDAYVRRMIVNEVRSTWRRGRRVESRAEVDADHAVADHSEAYERRDELHRLLMTLPAKQRAAVVMRYLDDLPDGEIAVVLGCSTSTVRVHVHRALVRLRVDRPSDQPVVPAITNS